MNSLGRYAEHASALLRILAGAMFMQHGAQKLLGVLGGHSPTFGSQLWVGGVIELFGGVLIAIGLFTRPAALVAAATMVVAYCQFHWKGHVDQRFFPVVNKGELAVLYALVFLFFGFAGGGRFSVDHVVARTSGSRPRR